MQALPGAAMTPYVERLSSGASAVESFSQNEGLLLPPSPSTFGVSSRMWGAEQPLHSSCKLVSVPR